MIELDGSFGEGGGQILRTSLSLSLITAQPFRITNLRSNRRKPGLRRQHLTAVRACAEVGRARVEGDEVNSRELTFAPRAVRGGEYRFTVGTGGSATLVCQAVLPALMHVGTPSTVRFEGGTHNYGGPPFDFLDRVFLAVLRKTGVRVSALLRRYGFAQGGEGAFEVTIEPAAARQHLDLSHRGPVLQRRARALVANLPTHIADRELTVVKRTFPDADLRVETVEALGPGNIVMVEIEAIHVTEIWTGFGERGVPAERVAAIAAECAHAYERSRVPVGEYLADQLLLPLATGCGGTFVTTTPTLHFTTNAEVIRKFLDASIDVEPLDSGNVCVRVEPAAV